MLDNFAFQDCEYDYNNHKYGQNFIQFDDYLILVLLLAVLSAVNQIYNNVFQSICGSHKNRCLSLFDKDFLETLSTVTDYVE